MTQNPTLKNKAVNGFTLVEILVVIAITAVLAAILIPVVGGVMTSSLRSESANNLRQLYAACTLYSNDHNLQLANAFIAANEEIGREQSGWWNQLVDGGYLGDHGSSPREFEVLGSPIQRREVPEITIDQDPPVYPTYGMNIVLSMIGRDETSSLRADELIAPGRTLFISEGYLKEGNSWFAIGVSPWGATPNHTDGITTFVYADGAIGQLAEEEFPTTMGEKGSNSWFFWQGHD